LPKNAMKECRSPGDRSGHRSTWCVQTAAMSPDFPARGDHGQSFRSASASLCYRQSLPMDIFLAGRREGAPISGVPPRAIAHSYLEERHVEQRLRSSPARSKCLTKRRRQKQHGNKAYCREWIAGELQLRQRPGVLQFLRSVREMPRAVILAVLALALLARLAVPAGWMPVTDADGARLTICTGMGALDAPRHAMPGMAERHGSGDHKQSGDDHVCPFAAVALALAQPALPSIDLLPMVLPGAVPLLRIAVAVGRGLAAPPPPATGPPSLD
jgi:hypothetical protein